MGLCFGPMTFDALENRQFLRTVIDILAEPLEGEDKELFVRKSVDTMNRIEPAPGKAQKRRHFRVIDGAEGTE